MTDPRVRGALWATALVVSGVLLLLFNLGVLAPYAPWPQVVLICAAVAGAVVLFATFTRHAAEWWRLIPALLPYIQWFLYASWAYIAVMVADVVLMWRSYKRLLAERHPGTPLRGLLMYGFNRQMTFRRWRRPAPRIKRGEAY